MEELDSLGQQTFFENGFVFVEGNETICTTFTPRGGVLTLTTVENGDTIVFTLTKLISSASPL